MGSKLMGRFDNCPHCGGDGVCPRGHCPVRDSPQLPAPKTQGRNMPTAAAKKPAAAKPAPKAESFSKNDVLDRWEKLPKNKTLSPRPIPYKHTGSTIDEDTIRLTGTKAFIEQALSNLKGLLRFENRKTRLSISYAQLTEKGTNKPIKGSYRCYIQVHQRG